jgi:hypothetical protein
METNNNKEVIVFNIPTGYEIDKEKTTANQVVYKYKEQINIEQEVKDFLFDIFNGLTIDLKHNTNYITYKKDDYIYMMYNLKNKCLYYDYWKIYSILKDKYQLKDQEINQLVKDIVYETLKLDADTTGDTLHIQLKKVYETLKLDADTTKAIHKPLHHCIV